MEIFGNTVPAFQLLGNCKNFPASPAVRAQLSSNFPAFQLVGNMVAPRACAPVGRVRAGVEGKEKEKEKEKGKEKGKELDMTNWEEEGYLLNR